MKLTALARSFATLAAYKLAPPCALQGQVGTVDAIELEGSEARVILNSTPSIRFTVIALRR